MTHPYIPVNLEIIRNDPERCNPDDKFLFNADDHEGMNNLLVETNSIYGTDVAVLTVEQVQAMLAGKVLVLAQGEYAIVILVHHE